MFVGPCSKHVRKEQRRKGKENWASRGYDDDRPGYKGFCYPGSAIDLVDTRVGADRRVETPEHKERK